MDESAKYLIHAAIAADGVVERSDVVGAVYGQTEGLLGEELDLRRLQESSRLGRIDVEIETRNGQSVGELTVATSLDRVETATLAAALETIERVGPCRATLEVTDIEDVREAKRRRVIDRAQELLLSEFEGATSAAIVEEVRRRVATADVTEFEGLPAGPNVADGDAVVVVEGRADVQALLAAGVKNAIAVEGTDVPDAVAALTRDRTTTAFLDGDRGGELVLRELRQVGDVDYVAFAPEGQAVEDLSRSAVLGALRSKVAVDAVEEASTARDLAAAARTRTSGGTVVPEDADTAASESASPDAVDAPGAESPSVRPAESAGTASDADASAPARSPAGADAVESGEAAEADSGAAAPPEPTGDEADVATGADPDEPASGDDATTPGDDGDAATAAGELAPDDEADDGPRTIHEHVAAVEGTGEVRFLGADAALEASASAEEAFDALERADQVPRAVVLDDELDQRLLDLAAQRGVREVVATSLGSFTKRPTDVRVRTADQLLAG